VFGRVSVSITYESVKEFARTHGDVKVIAPQGGITILKSGETDVFDLIEKAPDFWFDGKHYTRQEFEWLMSEPT
jgi:hypothetical protein